MTMGSGPVPARVMLIGDCIDSNQSVLDSILNGMLQEAGVMRTECYSTNFFNTKGDNVESHIWIKKSKIPHNFTKVNSLYVSPILLSEYQRVFREIQLVSPSIIVTLGDAAFSLLSAATGVSKWRGSLLPFHTPDKRLATHIPCYHPRSILSQYELRYITVQDFRRINHVVEKPRWEFIVRPSYTRVCDVLQSLLLRLTSGESLWLDFDLETRAGHIACAGISWSLTDALCIPFMCIENYHGYWTVDEESCIVYLLYKILTHPKCNVRWQNGLYDAQYTYRHWHFIPRGAQDTMISHHTCFPGLQKSLAFQASVYCDHYVYWKDDGKTWNLNVGEDQLWSYNCEDCVRTRECGEASIAAIPTMHLEEPEAFQQRLFYPVLQAMCRGVRVDLERRKNFNVELTSAIEERKRFFRSILGHDLNPGSTVQMKNLFYTDLAQVPIKTRTKKGIPGHVTTDDEALDQISKREPILASLCRAIQEYRSLMVFRSTFVEASLDVDSRMRCSFNICGTETFRLSSSTNAFGSGTNLQNIPSGNDDESSGLILPNVRRIFVPDPGYTFFDIDLDRADLQVVVWEADEPELKEALRRGVDMHLLNALALLGKDPDLDSLIEGTESCERLKHDYTKERKLSKSFIHGTNYGGSPRTMAIAAGITIRQAESFQNKYFSRYPGIKRWHVRTEESLRTKRSVSNAFGYKRHYFGRLDSLLPEALAWIPQSTVACVINRAWVNIHDNLPDIQVLLQIHDSLAGQVPNNNLHEKVEAVKAQTRVVVPYPEPLIIPSSIKLSDVSWGDCVKESEYFKGRLP